MPFAAHHRLRRDDCQVAAGPPGRHTGRPLRGNGKVYGVHVGAAALGGPSRCDHRRVRSGKCRGGYDPPENVTIIVNWRGRLIASPTFVLQAFRIFRRVGTVLERSVWASAGGKAADGNRANPVYGGERRPQRREERQDRHSDRGMENRVCQTDRRTENAQSTVSCTQRGSERSRADAKERYRYPVAGTAGTRAPQGAGYGAVTDRAARIVNTCPAALSSCYLPDKSLLFPGSLKAHIQKPFYFFRLHPIIKSDRDPTAFIHMVSRIKPILLKKRTDQNRIAANI